MTASERTAWESYWQDRSNIAARNRVWEQYLPICWHVVTRFRGSFRSRSVCEDVFSQMQSIMPRCVAAWDPRKNVLPKSYFYRRMQGVCLDYLREHGSLSRTMSRRKVMIDELQKGSRHRLNDAEVFAYFGFRVPQPRFVSLDAVMANDKTLAEQLADSRRRGSLDECGYLLRNLKSRDRLIVLLYWVEGWTMQQVAAEVGVTESRVSQLMPKLLASMRRQIER